MGRRPKKAEPDPAEMAALMQDLSYCANVLARDSISAVDAAVWNTMRKEKIVRLVKLKHPYAICGGKERPLTEEEKRNGKKPKVTRVHTRIEGGKQVYASSMDDLYKKLYDLYYGESTMTLGELFEPYIEWKKKRQNPVYGTIKRETNVFKKYIKDSALAKKKMVDIKASDIEEFFTSYAETLSRHNISAIKSILNLMFDFSISRNIVTVNIARQYNTRTIKTIAETSRYNVYTNEDREKILKCLENSTDMYDLLLVFAFNVCCRVGELRAIRWSDVSPNMDSVLICREIVLRHDENGKGHYVEVAHTKTGHDSGVRMMPLNDMAQKVLRTIKEVYGDSEGPYVFSNSRPGRNNRAGKGYLYETPIGTHLKKACEQANVNYRSLHKTRFWMASALADNGASIQDLMSIGGWSSTDTAMRYIRMNNQEKKNRALIESATVRTDAPKKNERHNGNLD